MLDRCNWWSRSASGLVLLAGISLVSAAGAAGAPAKAGKPATRPAATQPAKASYKEQTGRLFGVTPRLHIQVSKADIDHLRTDHHTDVHATVRESIPGHGGETVYENVAIHIKGGAGSLRSVDDKPALTLNFSRYVDGRRYHAMDKIHLNNSVQDASYMCDNLCCSIFRDAGVPAPRATLARVWLNDRDLGPFVLLEAVDRPMLKHDFKDKSGALFQGRYADIDGAQIISAKDEKAAKARLAELVAAANEGDAIKRELRLERILDMSRFRTFIALECLVGHWDGYAGNHNNYRIYDNPASGKFVFIPHDMDQVFRAADYPLAGGAGVLARDLLATPVQRSLYFERMAELRKTVFTPERLTRKVDAMAAQFEPLMREMGPDALAQHKAQTADLKQRIEQRIATVDRMLAQLPRPVSFDEKGVASIQGWAPHSENNSGVFERVKEDGKAALRISARPGGCVASYRTSVVLDPGKYVFEGNCKVAGLVLGADGALPAGVALRISGATEFTRVRTNQGWKGMSFEFEVREPLQQVVLVCEIRAQAGEACFEAGSLRLRRK